MPTKADRERYGLRLVLDRDALRSASYMIGPAAHEYGWGGFSFFSGLRRDEAVLSLRGQTLVVWTAHPMFRSIAAQVPVMLSEWRDGDYIVPAQLIRDSRRRHRKTIALYLRNLGEGVIGVHVASRPEFMGRIPQNTLDVPVFHMPRVRAIFDDTRTLSQIANVAARVLAPGDGRSDLQGVRIYPEGGKLHIETSDGVWAVQGAFRVRAASSFDETLHWRAFRHWARVLAFVKNDGMLGYDPQDRPMLLITDRERQRFFSMVWRRYNPMPDAGDVFAWPDAGSAEVELAGLLAWSMALDERAGSRRLVAVLQWKGNRIRAGVLHGHECKSTREFSTEVINGGPQGMVAVSLRHFRRVCTALTEARITSARLTWTGQSNLHIFASPFPLKEADNTAALHHVLLRATLPRNFSL